MPTDWTQEQINSLITALERIASREVAVPLPGGQGILGLFGGDITHGANDPGARMGQLTRQALSASGIGNATYIEVTDTDPSVTVTVAGHRATYPGALLVVKDASGGAGTNEITIVDEDGRTFDGEPQAYISFDGGYYWAVSDGENWLTIHTDTVLAPDIGPDAVGPEELQETGVAAGVYGGSGAVPVLTIDEDGRVTNASTAAPAAPDIKLNIVTMTTTQTYNGRAGLLYARGRCWGAGGGGGFAQGVANFIEAAAGGGAGGYSEVMVTPAMIGAGLVCAPGLAGNGGTAGSPDGVAGQASTIGAICLANGGSGGPRQNSGLLGAIGGAGGALGTGDILGTGERGGNGLNAHISSGLLVNGGNGASGHMGTGGAGGQVAPGGTANGANATGYGAGGGGGAAQNTSGSANGGNGSGGLIIWEEVYI